ncbi:MAG: DUF6468 domain-containing protein [Geminicoccaceae bacterium]
MVELAPDLLVAFLLVVTTTWCVLLHRRLGRLRIERRDIEVFVSAVDTATRQAEAAIGGIRAAAAEAQRTLGGQQETAQQRVAELTRLLDSGGRMVRRLESSLHQGARTMADDALAHRRAGGAAPQPELPAAPPDMGRQRTTAPAIDAELLRALEALR